jgi:hypothetical protein
MIAIKAKRCCCLYRTVSICLLHEVECAPYISYDSCSHMSHLSYTTSRSTFGTWHDVQKVPVHKSEHPNSAAFAFAGENMEFREKGFLPFGIP